MYHKEWEQWRMKVTLPDVEP
eukprot:COSAG02_NODE_8294_length_2628_cov_3.650850_1_plen_20_part_10